MPGRIRSRAGKVAAPALLVALLATSAAFAAPGDSATGAKLLDSRTQRALLDLYALDSRLHSARVRVASLESAAAGLRRERLALQDELGAARSTLAVSQRELAVRLRAVYEQGSVDPIAVVFGASSIGKGLRKLDDLKRIADESHQVAATARAARLRLLHARQTLAADARRLARSLAAAKAAERSLAGAVAARTSYIASLRTQARFQGTQVSGLVAKAAAAEQKTRQVQPVTPPVTPPPPGGRKLTVSATCYILKGTTASGMPVGKGVVAVDPTVIPLGTKLYIPGYGPGVAADVGGGIKGRIIDLWYPSYAECAKWGRRTVTITIY